MDLVIVPLTIISIRLMHKNLLLQQINIYVVLLFKILFEYNRKDLYDFSLIILLFP